jgi:molybdenum cofactor cytidylyltransferase
MGEPKQLLSHDGKTLVQRAVETARSVPGAPVAIVLGAYADLIRAQLDCPGLEIVENHGWRDGMGGSLCVGLSALLAAQFEISSVIFTVCDQPLVTAHTLNNLITAHNSAGSAIVASEYNGTLGVPALFARSLFPELLALTGPGGAQQIIRAHRKQAIGVPFQDGAIDIDTPADYARLKNSSRELLTPTSV